MRPEGLCECKIPVTPSGIEAETLRFVAQCLDQLRLRVLPHGIQVPAMFKTYYNFDFTNIFDVDACLFPVQVRCRKT